jgi:hypothetical protein
MVSVFMMQTMAIHPGDRIYVEPEDVIHDSDDFYEPFLIVERTMCDSQMKNIGQIQPAKKPAKDKINSAYQQASPRTQMSGGGIHASQQVDKNNQIACEVVCFHDDTPWGLFKQKSDLLSNNKLKKIKPIARSSSTARVFCDVHRLSA